MAKIFAGLVLLVFFQSLKKVNAAEGCEVNGVVYTRFIANVPGPFGIGNRPRYDNSSSFSLNPYSGSCPVNSQASYAIVTSRNFLFNCGFTSNFNNNSVGVVVQYDVIQCPLDDKLIFLSIPILIYSFRFLRKKFPIF